VAEGAERQVILEIFFDAQYYDLELLIESRDADETRSSTAARRSGPDASKYKGSKRVHAEFEPGDYTIKVVAKLPGASTETKDLEPKYCEFQLFVAAAPALRSKAARPSSLNYFGLLGPSGKNFGQLVFVLNDLLLHKQE